MSDPTSSEQTTSSSKGKSHSYRSRRSRAAWPAWPNGPRDNSAPSDHTLLPNPQTNSTRGPNISSQNESRSEPTTQSSTVSRRTADATGESGRQERTERHPRQRGRRSGRGRGEDAVRPQPSSENVSVQSSNRKNHQQVAGGLVGDNGKQSYNIPKAASADYDADETIEYDAQQDSRKTVPHNNLGSGGNSRSAGQGADSTDWRRGAGHSESSGRSLRGGSVRGGGRSRGGGGRDFLGGEDSMGNNDRDVRRVKSHSVLTTDRGGGGGRENGRQEEYFGGRGGNTNRDDSREFRQVPVVGGTEGYSGRGNFASQHRRGDGKGEYETPKRTPNGDEARSNHGPDDNQSAFRTTHRRAASYSSSPSQRGSRTDFASTPAQNSPYTHGTPQSHTTRRDGRSFHDRASALEVSIDPLSNRTVMHKKERRRHGRDSLGQSAGQDVREHLANGERRGSVVGQGQSQSPLAYRDIGRNRVDPRTPRGGRGDSINALSTPRNRGGPTTPSSSGRGGGRFWVDPDQTARHNNNNGTPAAATPKRPNVYEEYLTLEEVSKGLENGTLLQGPLRINKRNRYDAYCAIEGSDQDIFICGIRNRNRAFEGDLVAVKLLEGESLERELGLQKEKRARKKEQNKERQARCDMDEEEEEEGDEDEEEEDGRKKSDEEDGEDRVFGKVVYILDRRPDQSYAGTLQYESPAQQKDPNRNSQSRQTAKIIWFKPTDKRVPLMAIPLEHAPKEFLQTPDAFSEVLFRAHVRKWQATSQHPFGVVTGTIGQMGEIPIETEALLCDAGIDWEEFPDEVLECLPPTPWSIPDDEIRKRKDLREEQIFSIDPPTAKDLDDAVSCKPLPDGTFEVGVHIADVSHFVEKETALDKEAMYRATTVYLVQKAIPMLPPLLCEQLCSLNPGVDRLAFSVIWKFDKDARVIGKPWFGKSVIRSCAKLSYDHAQALIDGKDWTGLPDVELTGGNTIEDIKATTTRLYEFSVQMRKRRFENGALAIHSVKLWFALGGEGNPVDCGVYEMKESNRLIEEFMLLANMAVARKISTHYPEFSLLRRHQPPSKRPMAEFVELAASLGFHIDPTSSSTLQESFEAIPTFEKRQVMKLLCIKPMQRAKYFCTGAVDMDQWRHYALNVPMYTHFTSPIRRYCDLVVHRLLQSCLSSEPDAKTGYNKQLVVNVAKQCNLRKDASKAAQDASQRLYLCAYLHKRCESEGTKGVVEDAIVYNIGSRSLDVMVEGLGIEKRVWIEDLVEMGVVVGCEWDERRSEMKVYWKKHVGIDGLIDAVGGLGIGDGKSEVMHGLVEKMKEVRIDVSESETPSEDEEEEMEEVGNEVDVYPSASEPEQDEDVLAGPPPHTSHTTSHATIPTASPNTTRSTPTTTQPTSTTTQLARTTVTQFNVTQPHPDGFKLRKRRRYDPSQTVIQTIGMFQKIKVCVVPDISKSPPDLKVFVAYPDEEGKGERASLSVLDEDVVVSVPGLVEDAD